MNLPKAFSPEVMAELAKPVQTHDPRAAQLAAGVTPKWYVVEIIARDVEAELVKRQFGIYVPEEDETVIVRGRRVDRRVRMFPGYVFVFLWDTDANWSLIVNTRGVIGILGALTDEQIDKIRYCENCARPVLLQTFDIEQDVVPKRKKRRKIKRRVVTISDEVTSVRAWSAFEDAVMTLDSAGRIGALENLLGVSSSCRHRRT
jgi:transcription antitermination factor NusG